MFDEGNDRLPQRAPSEGAEERKGANRPSDWSLPRYRRARVTEHGQARHVAVYRDTSGPRSHMLCSLQSATCNLPNIAGGGCCPAAVRSIAIRGSSLPLPPPPAPTTGAPAQHRPPAWASDGLKQSLFLALLAPPSPSPIIDGTQATPCGVSPSMPCPSPSMLHPSRHRDVDQRRGRRPHSPRITGSALV